MSPIPTSSTPDPREEAFSQETPGADVPDCQPKATGGSRWRTAVFLALIYVVAVGIFLRFLCPLFPTVAGGLWIVYHFPIGLFGAIAPRMLMQSYARGNVSPALPLLGHAIYAGVYTASVVLKKRWLSWLFAGLIIINVRGCLAMATK